MAKKSDTEEEAIKPTQIPLLNDIVTNQPRRKPIANKQVQKKPFLAGSGYGTADLFAADSEPLTPGDSHHNEAADKDVPGKGEGVEESTDQTLDKDQIQEQTSAVFDSLVESYPKEVLRHLRDELTSLLAELDSEPDSPVEKHPNQD